MVRRDKPIHVTLNLFRNINKNTCLQQDTKFIAGISYLYFHTSHFTLKKKLLKNKTYHHRPPLHTIS